MKFFKELIKLNEVNAVYLVTAANAVHAIYACPCTTFGNVVHAVQEDQVNSVDRPSSS